MWTSAIIGMVMASVDPSVAADKQTIIVFTSGNSALQNDILNEYKARTDYAVRMSYDVGNEPNPEAFIQENLADLKPALVFAIGGKAVAAAAHHYYDVPVVYADVHEAVAARLGRTDLVGIAARPDPKLTVERLAAVLGPKATSVGFIRSARNDLAYWGEVKAACEAAQLTLSEELVDDAGGVPDAQMRLMRSVDVLLVMDDEELWTAAALARVFDDAARARFPVATYAKGHLGFRAPPALALTTDAAGIAGEAARITEAVVLKGESISNFHSGYPEPRVVGNREALITSRVGLNKTRAEAVQEWMPAVEAQP